MKSSQSAADIRHGWPHDIDPDDIRVQLDRVLASPELSGSRRLQAFLQFVVDESLAGRGERIKGFTIGEAVFSGDQDFDPQAGAIVRVEAGRLRRRLAEYYMTEGREDPILIHVPKGTYEPEFSRREVVPADSTFTGSAGVAGSGNFSRPAYAGTAILLLIIMVVAGRHLVGNGRAVIPDAVRTSSPFVVVLPFESTFASGVEERLASGLVEAIITKLSNLSGLSVMAHASILGLESDPESVVALNRDFGVTHILRGSLESEGNRVRANVQLVDAVTSVTVWADSLDGTLDNLLDLEDKIAGQVTTGLSVQFKPGERDRLLHRHTSDAEALAFYRQGLLLVIPPNDMTRVLTARRLFQRANELDPEFAGGYAGQSFTHTVTVLFVSGTDPTKELELGVALAKKAIDKDPDFGMGYANLAFAHAFSGEVEKSLEYSSRAVAVQPGDAFVQFLRAVVLILSRQPDQAFSSLSEAIRLDPVEHRTPYLNMLGIAYVATKQYANALEMFERNLERGGPSGPHMDVFHASALVELGRAREARQVIDKMLRSRPDFPAEAWLKFYLGPGDHLDSTMDNLYRLGLPSNE